MLTGEPYRPSRRTWLLIIMFTLLNMFVSIYQPKAVRFAMLAVPFFFFALFVFNDIRYWVLALPVIVTFGQTAIDYGPFFTSTATIAILFSFFAFASHRLLSFRENYRFPPAFKIVGAACIAQLASVFASFYLHDSESWNVIREGQKHFLGALLLPVIYFWYGRGIWLERFLKVLTLMLLVMTIYGIYQYTSGSIDSLGDLASGFDLAGRVYSTIGGGPNSYSGVLELLVPSVLASFFFFKSRLWKSIAFVTVILGILNVLYTFSRGGFLTVSATSFLYLIYRFRKKIWVPILSFLAFTGFISLNAGEFERQLTVFSNPQELMLDTSMLHRYTSYRGFINEILADPVQGVGWGSSEYYHGRTALYGFWEVRHEDSVDKITRFGGLNSMILEMPLKGGIFSIIALVLLAAAALTCIARLLKSGENTMLGFGFACGLAGFGIHQFFDNLLPWPQTGAFFWIIFALLASTTYPCCEKEKDSL